MMIEVIYENMFDMHGNGICRFGKRRFRPCFRDCLIAVSYTHLPTLFLYGCDREARRFYFEDRQETRYQFDGGGLSPELP